MALSAIELCRHALVKIGARPIANFDENSTEALIADILYPTVRDALLSTHPWSFATFFKILPLSTSDGQEKQTGYRYHYRLPADFLRVIALNRATAPYKKLSYRITGTSLLTNDRDVRLHYIGRVGEGSFPPFFDQALIARLCADFSLPLTESVSRSQTLRIFAEQELQRARLIDSQQESPEKIEGFCLTGVRQ